VNRTTLRLDREGDMIRVRAIPVVKDEPRGRVLTEFPFASLALRARGATSAFEPRAVRFTHAGESAPIYDEVFRAPVTFGADYDELELPVVQLAQPLASADPITSEVLEERIAKLAMPPELSLVERVRRATRENLDASPDDVAKALGVSARTLRRQLDQANTTFRDIAEGARRQRADELLATGMAIKEVAFALGFSEPSAFSRAYKRWTGSAPAVRGKRAR
jgi:AraC-like DNA-binding protein